MRFRETLVYGPDIGRPLDRETAELLPDGAPALDGNDFTLTDAEVAALPAWAQTAIRVQRERRGIRWASHDKRYVDSLTAERRFADEQNRIAAASGVDLSRFSDNGDGVHRQYRGEVDKRPPVLVASSVKLESRVAELEEQLAAALKRLEPAPPTTLEQDSVQRFSLVELK